MLLGNFLWKWLGDFLKDSLKNLDWLITSMDMTQWGIVASIFVLVGFMALRSKVI